jgi:hypothetical protein
MRTRIYLGSSTRTHTHLLPRERCHLLERFGSCRPCRSRAASASAAAWPAPSDEAEALHLLFRAPPQLPGFVLERRGAEHGHLMKKLSNPGRLPPSQYVYFCTSKSSTLSSDVARSTAALRSRGFEFEQRSIYSLY